MRSRSPRRLIVFCVLQFLVCFAASVVCSVPASATNYNYVTLTPEQTLALYGREFDGQYYNSSTGGIRPIHFDFFGTTAKWIPIGGNSGSYFGKTYIMGLNDSDSDVESRIQNTEFLIYKADRYNDWGGDDWVTNTNSSHANIALGFSVDLSGLSYFTQTILWSESQGWAYPDNEASWVLSDLSSNSSYRTYSKARGDWGHYYDCLMVNMPFYKWDRDDGAINEDRIMRCAMFLLDIGTLGYEDNYAYNNQNLVLNYVGAYDTEFYNTDVINIPHNTSVFLLIGTPTITGVDVFPATTTTTTGTTGIGSTVSYQTFPTVDLSALESGVGTMVQMQDEGNYYERIQIDQLNIIINQLNDIYNAMVQRGEVPVSLSDASPYPTLNSDVVSDVAGAVTSYTTAQLPDSGNGAAGLTAISSGLGLFSSEFQVLGVFFLTFSVFTWFIFRGRGQ